MSEINTMDDVKATQIFAIRNIVAGYSGQRLTPAIVEALCEEIKKEMRCGNCSWAFNEIAVVMKDVGEEVKDEKV